MSTGDSEGPAWNKFWMSMETGESESMVSGEGDSRAPHTPDHRSGMISPEGHRPGAHRLDSVMPGDSASANGAEIEEASAMVGAADETPFTFKFRAPNGRVHRIAVTASAGLADLVSVVSEKLGAEANVLGGIPTFGEDGKMSYTGFALSYLDNDGDTVSITTDHDLSEAIALAREARKDKVDLFVHDPEKAALPVVVEPQTRPSVPPTPPESIVKSRNKKHDGAGEEEELPTLSRKEVRKSLAAAVSESKQQGQIISGVPNELLLPGALVALGAVIVITFAVGRSSSR